MAGTELTRGRLRADLSAKAQLMYGASGWRHLVRALAADGGSAVVLLRMSQDLHRWKLFPLAWMLMKLNKSINGLTISTRTSIASGFVIQHPVGVVINGNAVIGPGCVVEGGVVIGSVDRRNPILESHVYVGSGAKIIGGVCVGSGSKIGANAVVVKDVPPGSTVVGIPGRVIG